MTQAFILPSPNDIDGTAYEVVQQSVQGAADLIASAREYLEESDSMILNAELQRALDSTPDDPQLASIVEDYRAREHPLARTQDELNKLLDTVEKKLRALSLASGYDPKHPPKE